MGMDKTLGSVIDHPKNRLYNTFLRESFKKAKNHPFSLSLSITKYKSHIYWGKKARVKSQTLIFVMLSKTKHHFKEKGYVLGKLIAKFLL